MTNPVVEISASDSSVNESALRNQNHRSSSDYNSSDSSTNESALRNQNHRSSSDYNERNRFTGSGHRHGSCTRGRDRTSWDSPQKLFTYIVHSTDPAREQEQHVPGPNSLSMGDPPGPTPFLPSEILVDPGGFTSCSSPERSRFIAHSTVFSTSGQFIHELQH